MFKKIQNLAVGISALLLCTSTAWAAANWSYSGKTGPQYWASLDPNYAECGWGKEQSPISINASVHLELSPLQFQFQNIAPDLIDEGRATNNDATAVEDTHSLQDDLAASEMAGNTLTINGDTYQLNQFHFHMPAEHKIRGISYPMEIHLIYRDAQAHLAVVAIMVQQTRAKTANSVLHSIAQNLTGSPATWQSATASINLAKILPKDWRYYHYEGSLTVPPCIEGVQWYVMNQPITITAADLKAFKTKAPGPDARPIQPLNGRVVQRAV
jgi:carbonic anhydrase